MNLETLASVKVDDITRTRSAGHAVNTHVIPARQASKPDYERMQRMVHNAAQSQPQPRREPAG